MAEFFLTVMAVVVGQFAYHMLLALAEGIYNHKKYNNDELDMWF